MSSMMHRRERKYCDSIDFFLFGEQNPPHPHLLPHPVQKSATQQFQKRSKNKLFDSADWVMTGVIPEPANYVYYDDDES